MSNAFRLISANLHYDDVAILTDINLSIKTGEHVALLGKSGSGKSTLLNALYQQQRKKSALIPQNAALVDALSVFHNVYMGQLNQHNTFYNLLNLLMPRAEQTKKISLLLASLGLDDFLFNTTGELSGGQKQRVAIARALFQGGQILLGDEPISALDSVLAREVMQLLHNQHETVVLAMHDVEMALCFADRIIGIKNGVIAIDRLVQDLAADGLTKQNLTVKDLQFLYEH